MSCSSPTKALLSKLKKGQDVLWRTIENLKPSEERVAETQMALSKRKLDRRSRDSLTVAIEAVDRVPRKRARVRQLTPEYEPQRDLTRNKRPRRASSTPVRHPRNPLHSSDIASHLKTNGDLSLERALLEKDEKENLVPGSSLPSPKLSRIVVDTSKSFRSSPKRSRPATSSLKTLGEGKKSRRGLTVSFVEDENTKRTSRRGEPALAGTSKRRLTRHAAQRDLGVSDGFTPVDSGRETDSSPERTGGSAGHRTKRSFSEKIIDSLNSSRYGAMERRYDQTRKEGKFPRHGLGNDPQLGYDWIAGLLDTSESYSEKDDEYFKEMREFRRVNYTECHQTREFKLPTSAEEQEQVDSGEEEDVGDHESKTTCVSSYMLNDRLFPMHMSSQSHSPSNCCPTCEDRPTRTQPPRRCVRVSVPHSLVQPALQPKPHRRRSFDPSDSMGLSKHCVSGWECAQPSMIPPQPAVDLKSSLKQTSASLHQKPKVSSSDGQNLLDTSHSIEYSIRSRPNPRK